MTTGRRALRLGNDVVDLAHPRCARDAPRRDRFVERILGDDERAWVEGEGEDATERRLWCAWAAKETAYKVACKLHGEDRPPLFRLRAFATRLTLLPSPPDLHEVGGVVRFEGGTVRVSGWASPALVHLAGLGSNGRPGAEGADDPVRLEMGVERIPRAGAGGEADWRVPLHSRFTPREWEGVHAPEAAWARLLARARIAGYLMEGRGGGEDTPGVEPHVEIVTSGTRPGRTPPRVLVDGHPVPGLDVSLSHHGEYAAWALLLPPAGRGLESGG